MTRHVLGIDLGTTNAVVAVADGKHARVLASPSGARLLPSVVAFEPDGSVTVGEAARDQRLVDAAHTVYSVKRLIGRPFDAPEVARAQQRFAFELRKGTNGAVVVAAHGEVHSLTEVSAHVLREAKRIAEAALGAPCERAVVTVPANFNELQRSATKAAGRLAGLEVIRILNEPTAAALAYGYGADGASRVAVYDLGGGTFDLTILELEADVFEVIATAGDSFLGGDDLDLVVAEAMADACADTHAFDARGDAQVFERLRAAAEWAKCELTRLETVTLTIEELFDDLDGSDAHDFHFTMSRPELVALTRPILLRTFDVCRRALAEAGLERRAVDAVILVGGATRMPLVREMVGQFFGKPPRVDLDPDLLVAQGAAIHGYAIGGRPVPPPPPPPPPPRPKSPISVNELRAVQAAKAAARDAERKQPAFAPPPPPPLPEALEQALCLPMTSAELPLLMDVTPHALGIETAGGLSEVLIRRNAPIPCEQSRTFAPASDGQTDVIIQIFQGEARLARDNEPLGTVALTGLPQARRGEAIIEVTFVIDASGTLDVRAVDKATGLAQSTQINLLAQAQA